MPPRKKNQEVHIEIRFVPLPPERRAGYDSALLWLYNLMRGKLEEQKKNKYDLPICPECKCELHLTTDGRQVCRNEICPNYS